MALLSFRLSIVFTIGLLLLNGFTSDTSVLAFVNEEGPERLRLTAAPPSHVIVTGTRNSPVYLACQAELGPDASEDMPNSSYGDEYPDEHNEEDDDEEEDDEGYDEDTAERDDDEDDSFLPHNSPLLNNNDLSNDERSSHRPQHQQQTEGFQRQYRDYGNDEVRRRRRRKRFVRSQGRGLSGGYYGAGSGSFEYVWYRNGQEFLTTSFQNQNLRQTHKGFRLFENGTLRIPYNRQNAAIAAGVYRCKASLIHHHRLHGQGSILSTECIVSIAYLDRDNGINFPNNTITVRAHEPIILPCPFQSYPAANITWSVNKTVLPLHANLGNLKENRFLLLQNGSLLISDVQPTDSGRYRCNATNSYATKNFRSSSVNVLVSSLAPSASPLGEGGEKLGFLMPPLQPLQLSVRAGETLRLHCACYYCRPQWTFTPRHSRIPIPLENFTHQVSFVNVSVERHEGSFTCRSSPDGTDGLTFNVTVLVPPTILSKITSYTSSVVATMAFNCSVAGNPAPTVTWYKNGREIRSNYIVQYSYPLLRINTLDPEDEGLYQCVAKNAAGEVSASTYLTIRDKQKYRHKAKRLEAIRCFPIDTTSLYLTFGSASHANPNIEYVMYYLASDDPFRWYSSPPTQLSANGSLLISGRMVEPFRNYTVFLRACSVSDISGTENIRGSGTPGMKKVIPSRLSQGVRCATQGYPILSTFFPNNGIFIWWPKYDGVEPTAFTIQLRHDGNTSLTSFTDQIIGTVDPLDDYMTYEEVEPLLGKIEAKTSEFVDWLWNEDESVDGSGAEQQQWQRRRRRRRQSHQKENRHDRQAFDLSKDRKEIFGWLATSGDAVDVDVTLPFDADGIRANVSDVQAAIAMATKQSTGFGSARKAHRSGEDDSQSSAGVGSSVDDSEFRKTHRLVTVTRVKVAGNVTGILLPNIRSVKVRVLGSIAADGEPMAQDLRFVLWKTIDTAAPRTDAINRFQASHIDARSVQFTWSRFVATRAVNRCLQLCYKNVNHDVILRGGSSRFDCQKIPKDASHFNVKDLLPVTMYKAFLKPCESKEALSDIVDFQTKHDVPGPVTNHELHRMGGTISITWGPPENRNGILQGYLIEWINEDNAQHSTNLSADATSFTFPNVTSDERINISIRALSSNGLGIPIYLNLMNQHVVVPDHGKPGGSGAMSGVSRRWLAQVLLIVFILLLFTLVAFWCCIVLRRKACKKTSSSDGARVVSGGAAVGGGPSSLAGGDARHHDLASDASAMQMMGILSSCNSDMHEMQTLIRSSKNCAHPNGGLSLPNGLAGGGAAVGGSVSYGQPAVARNTLPVVALLIRNRTQPLKHLPPSVRDTMTTVPLNATVPPSRINGTNGYTTTMASYKELLNRERAGCLGYSGGCSADELPPGNCRLHHRRPSTRILDDCIGISDISTSGASVIGTETHSPTNTEYLASNGPNTFNNKDSDRISSIPLATTNEQKPSPTSNFTSKSSCAAIPLTSIQSSSSSPSSSSSSSSSSSTPSSLSPASSQYVMKSRSPLALDSSQRRLLETNIDSNTSTTVDETKPRQEPTPPQQTQPVEIYDYDYATNCDDEKGDVRDNSRQLLLLKCREVPEIVKTALVVASKTKESINVGMREVNDECSTFRRPIASSNPQPEVTHRRLQIEERVGSGSTPHHLSNGVADSLLQQTARSYNLKGVNEDDEDVDDDDDDEELDNSASLLNTSSLSTKPLHQQNHTSSWNFRRPIIGPNG